MESVLQYSRLSSSYAARTLWWMPFLFETFLSKNIQWRRIYLIRPLLKVCHSDIYSYLCLSLSLCLSLCALLRFRAGVPWIKAHRFRFKPGADTSCPFCPYETEDELHVLCKCTTYNDIRPDFLRRDGLRSSVPYHSVMETTNQCRLQQTALFLIKAGKMRLIWNSSGI